MPKKNTAVMVMTARGLQRILAEGGSQSWVLNPGNALEHEYLVCVQNQHNGRWGGATEPHSTAFLIGRILDIVPSDETEGRYKIRIRDYARIAVSNAWKGRGRNPVRYISLNELGIDPNQLEWHEMPTASNVAEKAESEEPLELTPQVRPLTIAEAKEGLAARFGVKVEDIDITIRG